MPTPQSGESHDDFMGRCIPMVMEDGAAESREQAIAMCSSMWDHAKETMNSQINELLKSALASPAFAEALHSTLTEKLSQALKDISRHAEDWAGALTVKDEEQLTKAAQAGVSGEAIAAAVDREQKTAIVAEVFAAEVHPTLFLDKNGDLVLKLSEACDFKRRYKWEDLIIKVADEETRTAVESQSIDGMKLLRERSPQWR